MIFSCRASARGSSRNRFWSPCSGRLPLISFFQPLVIPIPSSFFSLQPFIVFFSLFQPFLAFFSLFQSFLASSLFSLQHFIAFFSLQSFLAFSLFQPLALFSLQHFLAWAGSVGMNSMFSLVSRIFHPAPLLGLLVYQIPQSRHNIGGHSIIT